LAPAAAIRPQHQGQAAGTDVVFEWEPAVDPDGDRIADYHFELSARPDMKWPLSMSFAKLISRTSDAGSARFTLKAPGELNPDRDYFWHVRAKDALGVWGPWSQTWSFAPRGPAPPQHVALDYDSEKNVGVLRWSPSLLGTRPVAYRVYASDEKGFSASDEPYSVAAGTYDVDRQAATKPPTQFPSNLLAETSATEMAVVGSGVQLVGANKAYFRVVAIDAAGKRSGPSDYVEPPRPIVYSRPVVQARVGEPYRYDVRAIRSLGDARMRLIDGKETVHFWDVEQPRFGLQQGPAWLGLDESSGRLSGVPNRAGEYHVTVAVTLVRECRALDPSQLQWGIEKTLDTGVETVGTSRHTFVISVAP
jgi:hypothetical protein